MPRVRTAQQRSEWIVNNDNTVSRELKQFNALQGSVGERFTRRLAGGVTPKKNGSSRIQIEDSASSIGRRRRRAHMFHGCFRKHALNFNGHATCTCIQGYGFHPDGSTPYHTCGHDQEDTLLHFRCLERGASPRTRVQSFRTV